MAIFGHVPGGEDFADIYEDRSAERVGERIKKIRERKDFRYLKCPYGSDHGELCPGYACPVSDGGKTRPQDS